MSSHRDDNERQLALVLLGANGGGELAAAALSPATTPAALEGELVDEGARPLARLVDPDHNPASVYLGQLAPSSARTMRGALSVVSAILADGHELEPTRVLWAAVRYEHAQRGRAELVRRYEPATVNRHLAALRRVKREAYHLKLLSHELYADVARIKHVEHDAPPAGRALARGRDLRALRSRGGAHASERCRACRRDPLLHVSRRPASRRDPEGPKGHFILVDVTAPKSFRFRPRLYLRLRDPDC